MGGIPIEKIDGKDFSQYITFVDQKIVLFNATISENLSMWNDSITFEQLTKAAKTACIHEWIINQPTGYNHKISENGANKAVVKKQDLKLLEL